MMSKLTIERVNNLAKILTLDFIDIEEKGDFTENEILEQFLVSCEATGDLDHIAQYVEVLWLIRNFKISYNNDNFDLSDLQVWQDLFNYMTENEIEIILILQLIISLCKISIINLQKLSSCTEIKNILKSFLFLKENPIEMSSLVTKKIVELYSILLSTKTNSREIFDISQQLPSPNAFSIFYNISYRNLNELPFINQLIFQNHYHHIKSPPNKNSKIRDYSIQFWIELNNVTSNRIMTIDENLIVEIRDEKLCLSNQEFMLAIYESFNFELATSYHISLIFKHNTNEWTLYVNNELINTLTLFFDTRAALNSFEIGSISCSFKLYSLKIWSIEMSSVMIKFINKLGPHFRPVINSNDGYWGCCNRLDENFMEQMYIWSESTHIPFEQFEKNIKQLTLSNLLIEYDIENTIMTYRKPSKNFEIQFDYEDDVTLGKCFYLEIDNIKSKFIAINIFQSIIYNIETSNSPEIIFQYVSLIITLCKDPQMMLYFKKSVGFDQLNYILHKDFIDKFNRGLPISFLNLFLSFCGWNFTTVEDSMLQNLDAYKHLIMDFNLWNFSSKLDKNDETVEVLRYLFFHSSIMQDDNNFQEYNIKQLRKLETFPNLCYSLYYNKDDCLEDISNEIILSVYNFIVNDPSCNNFKLAWQFLTLFLENNDLDNVKIFGDALNQVTDHWITINEFNVSNTVPIHLLLNIISVFCHKKLPITFLFKILLQELSFERDFCINFMKKNGIKLIFGTLTQCNVNELFDLIPMILQFSINKQLVSDSIRYDVPNIQSATSDANLPFLYLSINLIEWMVQNDILISSDRDLDEFIKSFAQEVINCVKEDERGNTKYSKILPLLLSLLATLTNPTNTNIYEVSANVITKFISSQVIECLKLPQSIGKLVVNLSGFGSFFDGNYIKLRSSEDSNFLDLIFFKMLSSQIITELLSDENGLLFELENNVHMIQNILELLDIFKSYFLIIVCNPETTRRIYELLFICGEVLLSSFPKSTKALNRYHSLLTFYSKSYCWMVLNNSTRRWSDDDFEKFDTNLVKYQAAIYGHVPLNKVSDIAQFLLYTLLYQLCKGRNSAMLILAIRALITFNSSNLEATLGHIHKQNLVLRTFLEEFLSSSDEIIIRKVHRIMDPILSENSISVYKGLMVKELSINLEFKYIDEDELNKMIITRKEQYGNFIHSESKTLNESLMQGIQATTNKTNEILWKKCNSYLISVQENIKIQENKINKLNGEIEHILYIRNGDTIRSLSIDTEENSERMRVKLIPLYSRNLKR